MVIPNIVTKFHFVYIFETFVQFLTCRLISPAAWKVLKGNDKQGRAPQTKVYVEIKIWS